MRPNPADPLFAARVALAALHQAQQAALGATAPTAPGISQQRPTAQMAATRETSGFEAPTVRAVEGRAAQLPAPTSRAPSFLGRFVRGAGAAFGGYLGGSTGAALGFTTFLFTGSVGWGLGLFVAGAAAGVAGGYLLARGAHRAVSRFLDR